MCIILDDDEPSTSTATSTKLKATKLERKRYARDRPAPSSEEVDEDDEDGDLNLNVVAREWINYALKRQIDHGNLDLRRLAECYVQFLGERKSDLGKWNSYFNGHTIISENIAEQV